MQIRGIVRAATLEENPPGTDQIEMVLRVQGVRPGQPRVLVVPYELLLGDESLDPDQVQGKGFEAIAQESGGRWVVSWIALATGRASRRPERDKAPTIAIDRSWSTDDLPFQFSTGSKDEKVDWD